MITRYKRLYFELLQEVESTDCQLLDRPIERKSRITTRHEVARRRLRKAEEIAKKAGSRALLPPLTDIDQLP